MIYDSAGLKAIIEVQKNKKRASKTSLKRTFRKMMESRKEADEINKKNQTSSETKSKKQKTTRSKGSSRHVNMKNRKNYNKINKITNQLVTEEAWTDSEINHFLLSRTMTNCCKKGNCFLNIFRKINYCSNSTSTVLIQYCILILQLAYLENVEKKQGLKPYLKKIYF